MEKVMLTICVPVYNHEMYIVKALDSIRMQNTKYSYEVLIGEDCSTDNTRKVLQKYQRNSPNNFHYYYRKENMYNSNVTNLQDLKNRSSGKYIITLEGDDYWISNNKIQCQIDFLEKHPNYIAVCHDCQMVDRYSNILNITYPQIRENEYLWKHYMSGFLPGQTATLLYRNIYRTGNYDTSILNLGLMPGDRLLSFVLLSYGQIYIMNKKMSAYRYVTNGGSSFSATFQATRKDEIYYYKKLMQYAKKIKRSSYKYSECLYFRSIVRGLKSGEYSNREFCLDYIDISDKIYVLRKWLKYKLAKDILKKEIWW